MTFWRSTFEAHCDSGVSMRDLQEQAQTVSVHFSVDTAHGNEVGLATSHCNHHSIATAALRQQFQREKCHLRSPVCASAPAPDRRLTYA